MVLGTRLVDAQTAESKDNFSSISFRLVFFQIITVKQVFKTDVESLLFEPQNATHAPFRAPFT